MTVHTAPATTTSGPVRRSLRDRVARGLLFRMLAHLEDGELVFVEGEERWTFGRSGARDGLQSTVQVVNPAAWGDIVFGGSVGAGRSYMEGHWRSRDLVSLIRILVRNREFMERWRRGPAALLRPFERLMIRARRNDPDGSRRNIAEHYDLSNEFFALFLDETMMYSAAVFDAPDMSLVDASRAKLDRLCRKLDLGPEDHVLEIGSGWGGFAIHAAERYGCRVTTTTISPSQFEHARRLIADRGLEHLVEVLQEDYRSLTGRYDKLVSIEMIEAVGHEYLETFFRVCGERLRPGGVMALQAIVIGDREYARAAGSVDFIKRYIFPGSCIPSMEVMSRHLNRVTDLRLVHLEDITPGYAETLRRWRERFLDREDNVRALGFDERFRRMWEFYLAYCEGGFRERYIGDVQMVLARPGAQISLLSASPDAAP